MKKNVIASMIDHTILKPEASKKNVQKVCEEAVENNFASVCINPCNVSMCAVLLKGSKIKVCTVIGFPLGATTSSVKVFEALDAVKNGADEVDMVINIGRLKDKDFDYVREDIRGVVEGVKEKAIVKVIIETCLLTDEEKVSACKISKEAGADFVKTSTGFSIGGASASDIRLMRKTIGSVMGIKAAGGIHSYSDAIGLIDAGASRIGASASIAICEGADN